VKVRPNAIALTAVVTVPALLAAGLVAYFSFTSGGYSSASQGLGAVVLALALVARALLSERPFAGAGRAAAIALAALAGFAAWSLLSASWSDAPGRALNEFSRASLYLLALAFFVSIPRDDKALRWMLRGILLAIVLVAVVALISKLLPDLLPLEPDRQATRLSYPLEYWNALGLLCAIGVVLAVHLTADAAEPLASRVTGAAAIPVVAVTLLLTFSRGALLVLAGGLVLYLVVARPRGLPGALTVLPPLIVALLFAYGADELHEATFPLPQELRADGEQLALVVALAALAAMLLRVLAAPLDRRLAQWRPRRPPTKALAGAGVALVLALGAGAVAADLPDRLDRQWDRFLEDESTDSGLRGRLTDVSPSGRLEQWGAALDGFERSWLHGEGAGTYERLWYAARDEPGIITDAHSLYAEQLGEGGAVGFALLVIVIVALFGGVVARIRSGGGAPAVAVLGAAAAWAVHAGIDWDWEMPAVTFGVFALAGVTISRTPGEDRPAQPYGERLVLALQLAAVAIVPALVGISDARLAQARTAFGQFDCGAAVARAKQSIEHQELRADARELLGYCAIRERRYADAVNEMRMAVRLDPGTWDYRYGLALALASAGTDPRREIATARRMNPLDPLVRDAQALFEPPNPEDWRRWGRRLAVRLTEL
jgi:O-antigen ligase